MSRTIRWCVITVAVLGLHAGVLVLAPVDSAPASTAPATPDLLLRVPCLAGDPFNPDDITGTLDLGALSCTGLPRNC